MLSVTVLRKKPRWECQNVIHPIHAIRGWLACNCGGSNSPIGDANQNASRLFHLETAAAEPNRNPVQGYKLKNQMS
jgi:hypothetical protein